MIIKMKSILFQTVFKNIRRKRRALFKPPALDSFARPIIDPKMPNAQRFYLLSQETLTPIFNRSQTKN